MATLSQESTAECVPLKEDLKVVEIYESTGTNVDDGSNQNQKPVNLQHFESVPADSSDLLLGVRALGLCALTYKNDRLLQSKKNVNSKEIETKHKKAAGVLDEDFIVWDDEKSNIFNQKKKNKYLESQCITGVIGYSNGKEEGENKLHKVPFVAFRGSVSIADFLRDAASTLHVDHVTNKGHIVRKVGSGFSTMLSELKKEVEVEEEEELKPSLQSNSLSNDSHLVEGKRRNLMDEVVRLVRHYKTGLIITGHSLGGAAANVFLAELALDYPELVEQHKEDIRVVTFGSPRAVTREVARWFDRLPIKYLRFVNNDDLITNLPPSINGLEHAGKTIFPFDINKVEKLNQTQNPLAPEVLPNWKKIDSENTRWMVVFDVDHKTNTYKGIKDFAADGKSDSWWLRWIPSAFISNVGAHYVVSESGYVQHFKNYNDPAINAYCDNYSAIAK